ncbi:MAG: sigma-70 family RNA polymerase sigma factor [Deltaproteobacteria bacterium]|nr:sigma-70 family RNA polymerase sigma factor [Deltaproteobacteria bacterium]
MPAAVGAQHRVLAALAQGRTTVAEAMAELYPSIHGPVRRLCSALVREPGEVDDVVQDVLLAIYRGLPRFRGDAQLLTWVRRITIRVALRHRDRRRQSSTDALPLELAAAPPRDPVEADQLRNQLLVALRGLPAPQRTVLALALIEGLPQAEIAQVLGIPAGTVWSRLHHARRRLARALVGTGDGR